MWFILFIRLSAELILLSDNDIIECFIIDISKYLVYINLLQITSPLINIAIFNYYDLSLHPMLLYYNYCYILM